jgi:hypothetical protein
VTTRLSNVGCGFLGEPLYRLSIEPGDAEAALELVDANPIIHYVPIYPGQSDTAEFVLRGVRAGPATCGLSVSFEFNAGSHGPSWWGYAGAGPVTIRVGGQVTDTPARSSGHRTTVMPAGLAPSASFARRQTGQPGAILGGLAARGLLAEVDGGLNEGFDTSGRVDARTLLDDLAGAG